MISTLGVIVIAVGSSLSFFIIVAISMVLFLRANDRQRRNKEEVTRQFSAGQRGRLSVGSSNYSHVSEPRTNLRRSTHLPYGVLSEGWAAIPSQESLPRYHRNVTHDRTAAADALTHQKRRRSLRASFSAHSFSLPKTRRQKRIEKAIPLRALPQSPLSAIMEQSGTTTSEASPSVGIAELPAIITPNSTPDRDGDTLPIGRPISLQWPLVSTMRVPGNCPPTIIPVPPSRNSTLMGMDSADHSIPPVRPSLGQRSISITSTLSLAPDDPLPPLPFIPSGQWPAGRRSRLRLSGASVDTIGSSVLGGGRTSPAQTDTDMTSIGLATPPIDLNPIGFQDHDRGSQSWEPATVITTGSPKARQATRYRSGKGGYGSFKASMGNHSSLQDKRLEHVSESRDRTTFLPRPSGSTLANMDHVHWRPDLSSRANSVRSHVSPSISTAMARTGSGHRKGQVVTRHSMYEQYFGTSRLMTGHTILRDISGNQTSQDRRPTNSRPASIASENPFHWDRNSLQTGLSYGLRSTPGSQRKGHKRQNCVRISNIPAVDTTRKATKLQQMTEEEEDTLESSASETVIPGLSLLQQEKKREDATFGHGDVENSPFVTRPILEPTPWKRPRYSRAPSSETVVSCKRDSDVFSNSCYDPSAPNIFTENSTPRRQWLLTSTPPHPPKSQLTLPSLRAIQEPYDPDSPTLPVPAISSATLFARALPLGTRVSGVQGPRSIATTGRSSRTLSPSPITARNAAKQENLRRSVMTLRRMNSDTEDKTRTSNIFRNIGDGSTNGLQNTSDQREGAPAAQPSSGDFGVSMGTHSSSAPNNSLQLPSTTNHRGSVSSLGVNSLAVSGLHLSKSRSKIAHSPSVMSAGATSIWEDASVRGDSPEPDLPPSPSKVSTPQLVDVEAYENFIGQDKRSQRDRDRESRLTSPQGKGLGLVGVQMQGKVWGTPGSLYDRDGFLKE